MVDVNPKGTDWTADEVDQIVAEYFKCSVQSLPIGVWLSLG